MKKGDEFVSKEDGGVKRVRVVGVGDTIELEFDRRKVDKATGEITTYTVTRQVSKQMLPSVLRAYDKAKPQK